MLGLADDAMVLGWLAAALVTETESYLAWEDTGVVPVEAPGAAVPVTVPSTRVR